MIIIGVAGVIYTTAFYLAIGPILFEKARENIFLHLEGNQMLYENFFTVTQVRGVLKLDFLFNIVFSQCLLFIVILE